MTRRTLRFTAGVKLALELDSGRRFEWSSWFYVPPGPRLSLNPMPAIAGAIRRLAWGLMPAPMFAG